MNDGLAAVPEGSQGGLQPPPVSLARRQAETQPVRVIPKRAHQDAGAPEVME